MPPDSPVSVSGCQAPSPRAAVNMESVKLALLLGVVLLAQVPGATPMENRMISASAPAVDHARLPITVLPTNYGTGDTEQPKYAATITVDVPSGLQVAAYGGAGEVWLGPPT